MFFLTFLETLALTSALSTDAFVSAFAYGTDKVKVPVKSCVIISIICTAMLTVALIAGDLIGAVVPLRLAVWVSFFIFLIIGSIKILSPIIKRIKKKDSLFGQPPPNGNDNILSSEASKVLSIPQSALLAIALSLDGLGIGFGAGLNAPNFALIITLSLITNGVALILGALLGNKLSKKIRFSLSWLSGVVLIALGISNVLITLLN